MPTNHWRASKSTDSWDPYPDILNKCLQKSPKEKHLGTTEVVYTT